VVHSLTNLVVMNFNANALLALGASPIMAHAPEELDEMVAIASAVVINIGTLDARWNESFSLALKCAKARNRPVVLDPVGAGASTLRTQTAITLLEQGGVTIVRGNASEIMVLAGEAGNTRGVDSTAGSDEAGEAAAFLVRRYGVTVCVSGEVDVILSADDRYEVQAGHPMMTQVTGMGCTASALCGAFAAVNDDPARAAAHAMTVMGFSGEEAFALSNGPGSLQVNFLDALHNLTEKQLEKRFYLHA
jgi:hydroxyethylthiazole kinase